MSWTTPRTWVASEVPDDTIMNAHLRDNLDVALRQLAYKSNDETVTSDVAVQNDDELFVTVGANEVWYMNPVIAYNAATVADIKVTFTWPTGSTVAFAQVFPGSGGVMDYNSVATSGGDITDLQGLGAEIVMAWEGIVRVGGTAGTVQLQWAQQSSSGTGTVMKEGSQILGCQLA